MRCRLGLLGVGWLLIAAGNAVAADNELTPQEKAEGWVLLFNGQDLTGWKNNNGKQIATPVEEGSIVPYKAGGYVVVYDKPFGDFVLRCDVKLSEPKCNSGIFLRVGDLTNPVYSGLEVQIFDGGTGMHDFGAIYDLVGPQKDATKPIGQWNAVEITCKGPNVKVVVNGEEVASLNCDELDKPGLRADGTQHKFRIAIKDMPRQGYLGFQDHGHKVWYKNVKLREL
ncbi:MAG: DUF1080 domain-containing protein [Planctomycetes bacterium]|nr:DUF1080 domain-containing protein [Planctomycetota bacterium]